MKKVIKFEAQVKEGFRGYIRQLEDEEVKMFMKIAELKTTITKAKDKLNEL